MGTSNGFAAFEKKLGQLDRLLSGPPLREVAQRVGDLAGKGAERQIASDIGDLNLSHWSRGNPIEIRVEAKVVGDGQVRVQPARKSRGVVKVETDGRQAYSVGDRRKSGTRTNKAGVKVDKTRKVKRAGGRTRGHGSWPKAVVVMQRETPKRVDAEVKAALRKVFD